jgi:uncharacterized protein (DUF736 family)
MSIIGRFCRDRDGFDGRLHTLNIDVGLRIVSSDQTDNDHAPAWRVIAGDAAAGLEVGAGWNRIGEQAGAYLSLVIDCPSLAQPIRANLFPAHDDTGDHVLVWNRASRSPGQG